MIQCENCGNINWLEVHHVMFGTSNRKHSEKYGLKTYLCAECHRGTNGVHNNKELDLKLKRKYQQKFESEIGSREEFMRIFGRNYLWESD